MGNDAKNIKSSENIILTVGIVVFFFFLFFMPLESDPWVKDTFLQDCTGLSALPATSCKLSKVVMMNYVYAKRASISLTVGGTPSDLAQDILGFRALVNQEDPYPILGPAFHKMGLVGTAWDIDHANTHPPMTFLYVAPIAFLSWNWASAIWAWFMLALIVFTFHFYGTSWKVAIGLTPIALLWPPITNSLGQFTIIWLFALAAGYYFERKQEFWSGAIIGLAAITKFFPAILVVSFLLKKKWLALIGFMTTFILSVIIVFLLHPDSISRYIEVNQYNSLAMIVRPDNSSLLVNSHRFGGWLGVGLVLLLFLSIIWANKECFYTPLLSSSPRSWMLLSYFSVALLPISWVYSLAPLLPIVIMLILRKKLSTFAIGILCVLIPFISPPFFDSPIPFAFFVLLTGIGLLFDGLPFKLFTAATLRDMISPA